MNRSRHRCKPTRPTLIEPLEVRRLLAAVSFAAPVTTSVNISQFNVAAYVTGDLNGDGIPDLVVGHDDGSGQVFLGTSQGLFTPGSVAGPGAQVLALADFNNDGSLDLATAVGDLPGTGSGTFGSTAPSGAYVLPLNAVALFSADVNGDGNADLIAVTLSPGAQSSQPSTLAMSVLLGNGSGSFKAPVSTLIGSAVGLSQNFASLNFVDFNNDGKLDVLTPFGVMLGKGDGSFSAPISFPPASGSTGSGGSSTATNSSALASNPAFAVGDFNGDGNLDVALLPPPGAPAGQIDVLLGKGDGTFNNATPISLGTSTTITALGTADLNGDGNADLIIGTTNSAATASTVQVLTGNGDGTFGAPNSFTVPGVPINVSASDFNGDGNLDLLAIEAPAGSVVGQGRVPVDSVSVLLNSRTTPLNPTVTLASSTPRAVAGVPVTLSVAVQPPAPPATTPGTIPVATNQIVPTGNVTFMQGTVSLGTVALKNGRAKLAATLTGVGIQKVTAVYSGDVTYASVTSSTLNEIVLLSSASTPLLVPALTTVTVPALFLPKDAGSVTLTLTNGGGGVARGRISIDLFLSATKSIDASAVAITAAALQNRAINLGVGQSTTLIGKFTVGSYPPGTYYLIGQIVPVSAITSDELTTTTLVNPARLQAAGMVFGMVGTHQNLGLTVTDSAGDTARLSLSGGGYGTVTQTNGGADVALTGTTAASKLIIAPIRGTFSFDSVTDPGALGSLSGNRSSVTGLLTIGGSISSIALASVGAGGSMPMTLGSGANVMLSLGTVSGVTLNSASAIRMLTASSWQGGQIIAPSIQTLSVRGTFDPDVYVAAGGKINYAALGSIDGGTWAVAGGIGTLRVAGDMTGASIYAGANAGPDNVLGTTDDRYGVATITSIFIGGADTSSLIAAGAAPLPGGAIIAGLTLIPEGAIRAIVVRGAVSADSQFLASVLPVRANLGGTFVATATDPRFQVS